MKRHLVCILLLAACGGGGNGSVELADLGTELGIASCARQFDCCTDAEIMEQYMGLTLEGQPITTEEQCVQLATAFWGGFAVPAYDESLAQGRVEYDGDAAADCVAAIEGLTCAQYSTDDIPTSETGCRPYLIPKVDEGGECAEDFECTTHNCVDMVCMPMPAEGDACMDNCPDGLYCGFDLDVNMDVCQPLKADGAACDLDRECASEDCDDTARTCTPDAVTCDGM
jgi:hypothetical protein